jgi:NAD-dependent deacetylase
MAKTIEETIELAASILAEGHFVTALTGAGISTPSGIPDFRSPGSGLWEFVDPYEVATLRAFQQHPEVFYRWVRPLVHTILNAEPNPAHYALSELGALGVLQAIITQNIDGLHQRAGSQVVYEVHGNLRWATCMRCYNHVPAGPLIEAFAENGEIPHCRLCGGVMKPDIILMGEQLPAKEILAARQAAQKSDVMLVAGSSLEVAPAGDLPLLAKRNNGRLVIVNLGPTHLDSMADVLIRGDVAEMLPRVVDGVRSVLQSYQ